jgi:starvation-inducible DNA-binding protein
MFTSTDFPSYAGRARTTVGSILEKVLVHESRLAASTHAYLWRVRGSPLQSIKRLFAEQGRQIDRWLGEITTCARAVGVAAVTPEDKNDTVEGVTAPRAAAAELLARHEAIIRELRAALDAVSERDPEGDTATLLNGLLDFHETSAWMLRLLLESPEQSRVV